MVVNYIYAASGIFILIIFFAAFGRFLWRVPSLVDSKMIKDIGNSIYRILCKSGFIVIVIIMLTYYICTQSPTLMHHSEDNGSSGQMEKGSEHAEKDKN